MVHKFSCDIEDCGRSFARDYELRKHKATHENPESVFHCPQCDFITLQKKSLAIHFSLHTGEKAHQCPDIVTSDGGPSVPCDYRTNDPAALSKHRKRVHGYVPPPSRSRRPLGEKDENATQLRRSPRGLSPPAPCPPKTCAPRTPKNSKDSGAVANPSPLRNEIIDVDAMDAESGNIDWDGVAFDFDEEMNMDTFFDPTLSSQWMARYEESYTTFEYVPEPVREASSPSLEGFDMDTRREGCLCPEWMAEAGIEGWTNPVAGDVQEVL